MAEEGGSLQAEPPRAEDVALLAALQAEADVLGVGHLDNEGQANVLRGDVEGALLAIGAANKDAGMLGEGLQESGHAVPPERDGEGLRLLDALRDEPGGEEGGLGVAAAGLEPDEDADGLSELALEEGVWEVDGVAAGNEEGG